VTAGDIETLKLDQQAIEDIRQIVGVEKISPIVTTQGQMTIGDISSELTVNFVDRDFFNLEGTVLAQGDFYTDDPSDRDKIIISSSALQLFNLTSEEALDKRIRFTLLSETDNGDNNLTRRRIQLDQDFRIVGIVEEEGSNYVYMPFTVSDNLESKNFSQLKVKVDKDENMDPVRTAIMDKGFMVSALSDLIEQANQVFNIMQIVLASFGIVALIVSAIGMFNTMTIALLERTQEIGIMKALGATSLDIWNMFLAESIIIGFFGGLGGIIMGMLGGEAFNYGVNILAGALGGEKIDMFYTPLWFIALIITFSTFVGFATGVYPAKRAAKINALVALRYK
jgi:putative ABC transport system permease protein